MCRYNASAGRCKMPARWDGLCKRHFKIVHKDCTLECCRKIIVDDSVKTAKCSNINHWEFSKYPQDRVPLDLLKDPKSGKLFKQCVHCREKGAEYRRNNVKVRKDKIQELKDNNDEDGYSVCEHLLHNIRGSPHPQNKVPNDLFLRDPEDPNSPKYINCKHCREESAEWERQRSSKMKDKKEELEAENKFYCLRCKKEKPVGERAVKLNGKPASCCKICYIKKKEERKVTYQERKEKLKNIRYNYIVKNQASCQLCNSIFLIPEEGTFSVRKLKIQTINNKKYVEYQDKMYEVSRFIVIFKELLEYRVLDFDHLPENELRERGILGPDDEYRGKKDVVTCLKNEFEMEEESEVCQQICCECHNVESMRREKGSPLSKASQIKRDYVNSLKIKGCSVCGYKNEKLLRFFELDHINPPDKIEMVSAMVISNDYSLKDVIEESDKTRVICNFCHRIHTSYQHENGLIVKFYTK